MTEPASIRSSPSEAAVRRRAFLAGWAAGAAFVILQSTINAFSLLDERPSLRPGEPFVWEYSSAVLLIALIPGVAWLLRVAPLRRGRWLRFGVVHVAGLAAFTLIHVSGFMAIRKIVYALVGAHYGAADWLYEGRKDAVAYFGFLAILATADWGARIAAHSPAPSGAGPEPLYHLREGARTVRVPLDEIVAVTSARNYVEFHLAGGRKPLVRETLSKVETDLAAAGFLRTHRSWLVNPAHVRAITPATAGDFRLELASGLTVPLSRRFPDALERLRAPAAQDA